VVVLVVDEKNTMKIRFYANLRKVIGRAELDFSDEDIDTLRKLLDQLITQNPEIYPHLMDEHGELRQDLPIFVNGRNPRLANVGLDLILEPEDVISLFTPIASGRMNVEGMRVAMSGKEE
jgi:MoaD family protein